MINHGLPSDLRRRVEKAAADFFNLTAEEKRRVKRDEVNPMGYHDEEHTKNVRDWKEIFDFFLQDPTIVPATPEPEDTELRKLTNQWPQNPSHFRSSFHLSHSNLLIMSLRASKTLKRGFRPNGPYKNPFTTV